MTQQIIDFGSFPNDPDADAIRSAFQKVQNNFTELYAITLSTGVTELIAGPGLDQLRSTGNVTINANISNIRLFTGSSNSLVFGTSTTPTAGNITRYDSIQPIYIDLAPNIRTVNATFTGTLTTSNFSMTGSVTSSLIPSVADTYDLGSPTKRWRDLYLSDNSLKLGSVPVSADGSNILMPNVLVSGNVAAGNITAGTVAGNLTSAVQSNITSVGTLDQLEVAGGVAAATFTGNLILPPGGVIQAPGANTQIIFNDSGNQAAVPGMTFDKANTLLSIQGDISSGNLGITGNAAITGNIGVNKVVASGNIEASNLVTVGIVATQTGITTGENLAISSISGDGSVVTVNFATQTTAPFSAGSTVTITGVSPSSYNGTWTVALSAVNRITFVSTLTVTATVTSARIKGNGNTTINGILEVVGNTSIGNITAVNSITGNTITLSGNVDSGNLIASGIIRVTGTANLGAVFSPGDANVMNSIVRGSFGATGAATFAGAIRADADASFYANVLANANMAVTGTFTASTASVNGALNAGTANIGNFVITSGGNATANIFTATLFSGNGANITFINGGNVTGTVPAASTSGTSDLANNIREGSYSNITGVGTLSSITTIGTFTGKDAGFDGNLTVSNGFVRFSSNTSIGANGTTYLTATPLTKTVNIVTGVAGGTGVMLPSAQPGMVVYVINDTSTNIKVYPYTGQYIDRLTQNTSFNVGAFGRMTFIGGTSPYWFTMTSIYA